MGPRSRNFFLFQSKKGLLIKVGCNESTNFRITRYDTVLVNRPALAAGEPLGEGHIPLQIKLAPRPGRLIEGRSSD
jgi:hypothetical protein